MIKAVIFDFGQTLANSAEGFKSAEKQAQQSIFSDLQNREQVMSMDEFMDAYRPIRKRFHDRSNFSRLQIWQDVYRHYDCDPASGRLEKWERRYWETVETQTSLFPEAMHTLTQLAENYILALITNSQGQTSTQERRLRRFPGLARLFESVVVAGESGIPAKPAGRPFFLCLDQIGLKPDAAVYVGDDWRIDVCGARDAGLSAVWLKHHAVKRNWPNERADIPVITALDQLPKLLTAGFA